jgi:magnesium-protoporphyrin O-methyltransferase
VENTVDNPVDTAVERGVDNGVEVGVTGGADRLAAVRMEGRVRMSSCNCCPATVYGEIFGARQSRHEARRFRRRGLDRRARQLLSALAAAVPLEGATSLEVGAGVGGFSLTLLERGVTHATTVDASPAATMVARELAEERGVGERIKIEVGDFAVRGAEAVYDVVILDRVVCCYPDWRALLAPAAGEALGALALTYPRDLWYMRWFRRLVAASMFVLRKEFRFYIHPPDEMRELLKGQGLQPRVVGRVGPWELVVAVRDGKPISGLVANGTGG